MLNKQNLKTYKPKVIKVELPELDGFVYAKSLTANELRLADKAREDGLDGLDLLYPQVICAICDEDGNPIFSENDKNIIADLPFSVVKKMSEAVNIASGIDSVKN